jgi:hypothetical protein
MKSSTSTASIDPAAVITVSAGGAGGAGASSGAAGLSQPVYP